jgi:hypothetical protein
MTDQELQSKVNHLDTTVYNANNYALSLERRIMNLEKHNRTFLVLNVAGLMSMVFVVAALVLLV